LRYEGLIEAVGGTGMVDNAEMRLTRSGHEALRTLLKTGLRAPSVEFSQPVLALKLRFLPILDDVDRRKQLALIRESCASEIVRLKELSAATTSARRRFAAGSRARSTSLANVSASSPASTPHVSRCAGRR